MEKLTDKESFELQYCIKRQIEEMERMYDVALSRPSDKDYKYIVKEIEDDLLELRSVQKKILYLIEQKKI